VGLYRRLKQKIKSGLVVYGLASLFWFLVRTGSKPSRIAYPCQRAALSQSVVLLAVTPFALRDIVHFLRYRPNWNAIFRTLFFVGLIGTATLSTSFAYDKVLALRNTGRLKKISAQLSTASVTGMTLASPAQASVPSPHRVVMVHDSDASSWTGQSPDYWNMINQAVVDEMVYRGLKELTGTTSVAAAWQKLIPDYQPHQKIAIKINNNNVGGSSNCGPDVYDRQDANSNDSNAIIEPVNAVARSLLETFGTDISPEDIWVYESYKCFYKATFMDRAISGIQFFSASSDPDMPPEIQHTGFSGTAPNSKITFRFDPSLTLALNDVVANADYLINIPIVRKHSAYTWYGSATLGFKNHFGSIKPAEGTTFGAAFHLARYNRTNNCLVDINNNPHIKNKTVLILGEAIIGSSGLNYIPPELWTRKFSAEGTPEMLFFAVDPVAADSAMADLLFWERGSEDVECTRNYMLEAMDIGLGVAEMGTWSGAAYPNVSINYNNIDFVHINQDLGELSISVTPDTWSIGTLAPTEIRTMTAPEALTVTNDGALTGTLSLQITNPGTGWTPGTSQGVEIYLLQGLFCGDSDDPRSYFASDDVLSATATLSTPSVFGNVNLSNNGVSLVPGEDVKMWLRFGAPTRTSRVSQQTVGVTISIQPD